MNTFKTLLYTILGFTLMASTCTEQESETEESSNDIGCVIYVKNLDGSGNLIANWAYTKNDTTTVGTGYTTQSPGSENFAGTYTIIYTGESTATFSLHINKETSINDSTYYEVQWLDPNTNSMLFYGTGIEVNNQLIVGWRQ